MDETAAPAAPAAPPPPPVPRTIGERLRAGRERAGLSVAASAEKLHLDTKVIEALESDRFADLGASVYIRGHLKRYADFVGEPGAELVATYTAQRESRPPPQDLTQIPQAERHADPRRLVTPLVGLGSAAVLAAAIWWVLAGSQSRPPRGEVVKPTLSAEQVVAQTPSPAPAPVEAALPSPDTTPEAAPTPAPVATETAPRKDETSARSMRLELELASDSWVEVYDSRGERLFYDVASAGSVQSVEGKPPLRVVLGNSTGVTVAIDGQAREIPSAALDGEGARFVVNRSGSLSRAR
ncbi:MAG TPA: RodZ domain-containing protein [Steroidobacteraceae bacterium]|nr:RodZ domain-containing protein [Steroidobacteraceae bacterium]